MLIDVITRESNLLKFPLKKWVGKGQQRPASLSVYVVV